MPERTVRVLMVDDDEDDYLLARDQLAEATGGRYHLDRAADFDAAVDAIRDCGHDVYLVDYRLNGRTGLELIRESIAAGCTAPMLILTGVGDSTVDIEAMRAGAVDFLVKDRLDGPGLERAIRYALERKRAEDALREAREQLEQRVAERTAELSAANAALEEADRRKDEFLAVLAHELRNPLATIRNVAATLRSRVGGDPELGEASEMLVRQVRNLSHLIDDLMDVARIARGTIELRVAPLDLAALTAGALAAVGPQVAARRHKVETALPPEPVWVDGDATRLEQVVTNLLTNAARYTPPGGDIRVELLADGTEALLRVCDSGIGIRSEMLNKVFEMFQQADRLPGRPTEGLGVGLTLVKRLVEQHGGRITAASAGRGAGSEFQVRLPLRPGGAPAKVAAKPAGPARPRRVLIVDDNPDAAKSLAAVLRHAGHDVQVVHDGAAAVAAVAARLPDVALLDIHMPGMDGYETARQVRELPGAKELPLVALTGFGSDDDLQRSRAAGFDNHMTKPVDTDELLAFLAASG